MTEVREGNCLCGDIRYRVSGKPIICLACHCTFCQRVSSSAYSSVAYFNASQVEIDGAVRQYEHRSDETGRLTVLKFCPRCGVTVAHTAQARPGWIGIEIGTLRDKAGYRLERHVWVRSKQPCTAIPEDVDLYDKGSADGAEPIRRAARAGPAAG